MPVGTKWKLFVFLTFEICLNAMFNAALAKVVYSESCQPAIETGLPVCKWQDIAVRKPKAMVLLIHGLTQRAYSLNELAESLALRGFIVFGLTQRGHGGWHYAGNKNAPGYNCNFKDTVGDICHLIPSLSKNYPRLPLYMIGESVGAAVVLNAVAQAEDKVGGVILCSCGTKRKHLKTSWVLADTLYSIFRPHRQIDVGKYQLEYAAEDPSIVEQTLKDSFARHTLSGLEILAANRFIKKNAKLIKHLNPETSVLVVQGEADRVVTPESARKVFDNAVAYRKEMILVPKSGHMLIGRPNTNDFMVRSMLSWLNEDLDAGSLASKVPRRIE